MATEPIILIADETLSVQAQLGDALGKRVSLVSAMNQEQLDYWVDQPERKPDLLVVDQSFTGQQLSRFCHHWKQDPETRQIGLIVMGPDDDDGGHVIAGDIMSPAQTEPMAAKIVDWARGL